MRNMRILFPALSEQTSSERRIYNGETSGGGYGQTEYKSAIFIKSGTDQGQREIRQVLFHLRFDF